MWCTDIEGPRPEAGFTPNHKNHLASSILMIDNADNMSAAKYKCVIYFNYPTC